MNAALASTDPARLARIAQARRLVIEQGRSLTEDLIEPWIAQSWQRCLQRGMQADRLTSLHIASPTLMRDSTEANRLLLKAGRPVLHQMSSALAQTGYFVMLCNAQTLVIDCDGAMDRSIRHVAQITRVGLDLSEAAAGTNAIGMACLERRPVWLHQGEHFYEENSVYSCAAAPFYGLDGAYAGTLGIMGVRVPEHPELMQLASQAARRIERALLLQQPYRLLLRINWSGMPLSDDSDGLITVDADGRLCGANSAARSMLPALSTSRMNLHVRDLFSLPWDSLFEAARQHLTLKAALWNGLTLELRPEVMNGAVSRPALTPTSSRSLREMETNLIRTAVEEARGNVALAARTLGISRTTIYRKIGK